jgi:hypothetical protein
MDLQFVPSGLLVMMVHRPVAGLQFNCMKQQQLQAA